MYSIKKIVLISIFLFLIFNSFTLSKGSNPDITFISNAELATLIGEKPNINPDCIDINNEELKDKWFEHIKLIKLKINEKKYYQNIINKAGSNSDVNNRTERTWSEYYKAEVQFKNSNCKFKARYRLTGDLNDHIGEYGSIQHSMKIKLLNGRVGNITKFKLFTPESRQGKYEILNVIIHKELGLIAPRTALIDVQIGGQIFKAIFQEDISKELLEYNNFHESLIIEGDEGYVPLTNPRIVNTNLIKSSYMNAIAKDILRTLGKVFLNTNKLKIVHVLYDFPLAIDFLPEESKDNFILFHLLNFSLNTSAGLSTDDHRIIYDLISKKFYPIYYDGHYNERIGNVNFEFTNEQRNSVIAKLKKININKILIEAKNYGAHFSVNEVRTILENAISYLYETNIEGDDREKIPGNYREHIKALKQLDNDTFLKQAVTSLGQDTIISWRIDNKNIRNCEVGYNKYICADKEVDIHFFNQNYPFYPQNLNNGLFIHAFNEYQNSEMYSQILDQKIIKIGKENTLLKYTTNIDPIINYENKTIFIERNNNSADLAQIQISEGILSGWSLNVDPKAFLGYEKENGNRISKLGLTGCITFNDIMLENVTINLSNSFCEDAIHFVRTSGHITNLNVNKSAFDAIDIDFSNLVFENLNVNDAGNDCIDFSFGDYDLYEAKLTNCVDKAVSAGETAVVKINKISINKSDYGIVSKDNSKLVINSAEINNTKICLSAYRKKQEFAGGSIKINNNINCNNAPSFIQKNSELSYKNLN